MGTISLSRAFQRIRETINAIKEVKFSRKNVRARTGCSNTVISSFLANRTKTRHLRRVGYGIYQRTKKPLPNDRLPLSLVSLNVWKVLKSRHDFLMLRQITSLVSRRLQIDRLLLVSSVAVVLHHWHRNRSLKRRGKTGRYSYKLRTGITERPLTSHNSHILP